MKQPISIMCAAATTRVVLAVLLGLNRPALGGDLNPPPGPVASTMKPLDQVEPRIAINEANTPGDATCLFKITGPGSYYLTGNINGVAGKHGIKVESDVVTIDLMGFAMMGGTGTLDGISISVTHSDHLAVRNGKLRGWGGTGLNAGNAWDAHIEELHAALCSADGMRVGKDSIIRNCSAYNNRGTATGIWTGPSCLVSQCTAIANYGHGIFCDSGSVVENCNTNANKLNGITVGWNSIVRHCASNSNYLDGIANGQSCYILDNQTALNGNGNNDGAGVHAFGGLSRIEANTCTGGDRGIDVDAAGNLIIRNSASGNTVNYDIVANNKVGKIVSAPNSAAISGSTGGAGMGDGGLADLQPWNNISY